jgi:hypothetical protein
MLVSYVRLAQVYPINSLNASPGISPMFPDMKSWNEIDVRLNAMFKFRKGTAELNRDIIMSFVPYIILLK